MRTSDARPVASRRGSTAQLAWLLVGDVADLLENELDAENARWLLPVLESLQRLVDSEDRDDAAAGYLDEVLDQFPNAYDRVAALHELRKQLHSELHVFVHQLGRLVTASKSKVGEFDLQTARVLKLRLVSWADRMTAQHRHERELSQAVWYLELGLGD
ncbi:hypothetical protein GC176_15205 [bacterium]|nr:hypothetical protein [bacterium]